MKLRSVVNMSSFRMDNRYAVYLAAVAGLYMKSLETVTDRKWVVTCFKIWCAIPLPTVSTYLITTAPTIVTENLTPFNRISLIRGTSAFTMSLLKVIYFYFKRHDIERLIDLWDSSFQGELFNSKRLAALKNCRRRSVRITYVLLTLVATSTTIYVIAMIRLTPNRLNHPTIIPFRHQYPDFHIMALVDTYMFIAPLLIFNVFDIIVVTFLLYTSAQINHLRDALMTILREGYLYTGQASQVENKQWESDANAPPSLSSVTLHSQQSQVSLSELPSDWVNLDLKTDLGEIDSKMKIWIFHHQQVIRFFKEMSKLYAPIASIQVLTVLVYLCLTAFGLSMARLDFNVLYSPFSVGTAITSLYIWSGIFADIEKASGDMFGEAFQEAWFLYPKKVKDAISFITTRSTKPLILKAFSVVKINVVSYFQLLKLTYEVFTFMNQVTREKKG